MTTTKDVKTVIVTPQLPIAYPNGGIGTSVDHFVDLLVDAGYDVSLLFTFPTDVPEKEWKRPYEQKGVAVRSLFQKAKVEPPHGFPFWSYVSQLIAEALPSDVGVVYFADWLGNGQVTMRRRRYNGSQTPVTVTVLHGNSEWHRQGMWLWPGSYDEMIIDFNERYAARYSDYVVSPSAYMLDWAHKNSWKLPPDDHCRVLPLPFHPHSEHLDDHPPERFAERYHELIFFGRFETRKGFELFVDALIELKDADEMQHVEQVTLLGTDGKHRFGDYQAAVGLLRDALHCDVQAFTDRDTFQAQSYLRERAADALVVIPSLSETLGFTVIEASLIPGLNVIFSNAGAIPEVIGSSALAQMFEPYLQPFIKHLRHWLSVGPRDMTQGAHYDWNQANRRWLAFHEQVCQQALRLNSAPAARSAHPTANAAASPATSSFVDVCMPFYNLQDYLEDALESLERQTTDRFNLYVLNDGSTDERANQIFNKLKKRYAAKTNWHFLESENVGVCAARNLLAAQGTSDYILFMDADNIARPNMVERFHTAICTSGDDCLTSYMYVFPDGDEVRMRGEEVLLTRPFYVYIPIGNYPAAGMLENTFGDLNCIIRRTAFESVGGFTLDYSRYVNQEDRELLTILALNGYRLDVIPEFLFFYRHREASRLRTTSHFQNEQRVLRNYEAALTPLGLEDIAPLLLGLKYRARQADQPPPPPQPVVQLSGEPVEVMEFLINRVRWYDLMKAIRIKVGRNFRRLRSI